MRTGSRSLSRRSEDENPYWISYSDLMSALLVVFLLTAIALIIELTEKKDLIDQEIRQLMLAEEAREQILERVKDELERRGIEVQIAENKTVLRIPENTLSFLSNQDRIPRHGGIPDRIKTIGVVFHRVICAELETNRPHSYLKRYEYLDTVFIEGHTDSEPAPLWDNGNWGLSAARAISLWKFWEDSLSVDPPFSEFENTSGEKLFSVSGYADSRRIEEADHDDETRARNRRIDIRITIMRPTIQELQKVVDK